MGGKAPKAPDYGPIMQEQLNLDRRQFEWSRQLYETDFKPRQDKYDAILDDQVQRQNEISDWSFGAAKDDRQRYFSTFAPVEASLVAESLGLDPDAAASAARQYANDLAAWEAGGSQGTRPQWQMPGGSDISGARNRMFERAAGQATGDVQAGYASAEGSMGRSMSRAGFNPADPAALAMATGVQLSKSKDLAGASTMARRQTEADSWSKRAQAAGMGTGERGLAMAGGNQSLAASGAAAGTGGAGFGSFFQGQGIMRDAYNSSANSISSRANMMGQQYQANLSSWQASRAANPLNAIVGGLAGGLTGGISNVLGAGAGAWGADRLFGGSYGTNVLSGGIPGRSRGNGLMTFP
jgi:hypothetical protein